MSTTAKHRAPPQMVEPLLNDLCVFYVALTRAKKQAFISASKERYNTSGRQFTGGKICCFALIKGINLVNEDHSILTIS